mmetsp:Transcript_27183/g.24067  ORF Transcript_27183/g.24067 Transcript_27183/m.24067 type:complete len:130 (+) Transcript_27183:439-828(+)
MNQKNRHVKYMLKEEENPKDAFLELKFTDGALSFVKENGKTILKFTKKMSKLLQKVVKIRNKILNSYTDLKKQMESSTTHYLYQKSDVVIILELMEKFKHTDYYKPHYLWDIPKKTHNNEYYEDGEMTD